MTGLPITVSATGWARTLEVFEPFSEREVEGGCLWYGRRDIGSVELIGVPRQVNQPRYFEIPSDALAELNLAMPPELSVLAQLHAHPGRTVRQSPWDDICIVSRRVVSVVLPGYGRGPVSLESCGIHRVIDGRWTLLRREASGQTIELTPDTGTIGVMDLR